MRLRIRDHIAWILVPALLAGALALLAPWRAVLGTAALFAAVGAAARWPMLSWSLVVLTYPFIYLQLVVGETVNVPYVDVLAALTVVGVAVRCSMRRVQWNFLPLHEGSAPEYHSRCEERCSAGIASPLFDVPSRYACTTGLAIPSRTPLLSRRKRIRGQTPEGAGVRGGGPLLRTLPGVIPYIAFLLVGVISLQNSQDPELSVKYLVRPLAFFYPMFVVLPLIVVDTPRRMFMTFRILFAVGGIAAAMGLWSIIAPADPSGFRRAVPTTIMGVAPLGANHNLIAEVLVSVIPIGMILASFASPTRRRWYVLGTAVYALVTILTFSRNGWLTLALEGMVVGVALARERGWSWRMVLRRTAPLVAVALFAIGAFSFSHVARSSNVNRLQLTEIALEQFRAHPWIGAGVGTFIETVRHDRWYLADFGQPQEAHGLGQKLLAETGILGLLTFAALLTAIILRIIRVYRTVGTSGSAAWQPILLALLCSVIGSIVFQLFNTSYFVSKLWLPLGVALAAAHLAERGIALRREDAGLSS